MSRRQALLIEEGGVLKYYSPYNMGLIEALKAAIPSCDRRWNKEEKVWLIVPTHAQTLVDLTRLHLGQHLDYTQTLTPSGPSSPQTTMTEDCGGIILDVRYIGATKNRGGGFWAAYGWYAMTHGWTVVFPESVLRAWFKAPRRPDEAPTLYAALGIEQSADELAVKKAYRRLAMQWHPDVAKEPEAAEMFMVIKKAYDVLSDNNLRARYDVGLRLAATTARKLPLDLFEAEGYRPPLRCGLIEARVRPRLDLIMVEEIVAWDEIKDEKGRVLITTWPPGAAGFISFWMDASPNDASPNDANPGKV